ncbi:N-acetylmuramoyl-L-alanine amidase [Enterobacteriaceae bacterium LUAb1]
MMTVVLVMLLLLSGCTIPAPQADNNYSVNRTFTAVGKNERIQFLIMHYTSMNDRHSLERLTKGPVSIHYLIPEEPELKHHQPVVLQLVDENQRAWHAGISYWNGRTNLNDTSVGIEIVNPGYTDDMLGRRTWYPYHKAQIAAVAALAKDIIQRYQIRPDNVLGHSDVAPLRKQDPGKLFPWKQLASMGIGAWPDQSAVKKYLAGRVSSDPANVNVIQALLKRYGYDQIPQHGTLDEETRKILSAFQMHFRPDNICGNADAETEAIARALVEKYR